MFGIAFLNSPDPLDSYMLVVQASDGARVDTATVLIDILSINDKNPRFEKSFYRAEVSEGQSA